MKKTYQLYVLVMALWLTGITVAGQILIQPKSKTVCTGATGTLFTIGTIKPGTCGTWLFEWYYEYGTRKPVSGEFFRHTNGLWYLRIGTERDFGFDPKSPGVQKQHEGNYIGRVICGNNTSSYVLTNMVSLTVDEGYTITTQPLDQNRCTGSNFNLFIEHDATINYQWYKGATLLTGETSRILSFTSANTGDAGNYRVRTTTAGGCRSYSQSATVTIVNPPEISVHPSLDAVCEGSENTVSTTAIGGGLSYQWQISRDKNGTSLYDDLEGATSSSYTFTAQAAQDSFNIRCRVDNACSGYTYTNPVLLRIKKSSSPPSHISASDTVVCPGEGVSMQVQGGALEAGATWEWYIDSCGGTKLNTGASVSSTALSQSRTFFVRGEGDCGQTSCQSITIHVKQTPIITKQPTDLSRCTGDTATLHLKASGFDLAYSWEKDGSIITGANQSFLHIPSVQLSDTGSYRVSVSNGCTGLSINSAEVRLEASATIDIDSYPDSITVCEGEQSKIPLSVRGARPITFIWTKDETPIDTTTSSTYSIDFTSLADSGVYQVSLSNNCATEVETGEIHIQVHPTPAPVDLGPDTTICLYDTLILTASEGYNYQWNQDNNKTRSIRVYDTGTYTVSVSNSWGCENSGSRLVNIKRPYEGAGICMVSLDDTELNANMIVWEPTEGEDILYYNIYKLFPGYWDTIGRVQAGNNTMLTDSGSNPAISSYRYRMTITDGCMNESSPSPYHSTMHLQINQSSNGGSNLLWTHYREESGRIALGSNIYYIYRGISPYHLALFDSVAVDSDIDLQTYNDTDTSTTYYYQIASIKQEPCDPAGLLKASSGPFSQSISNIEDSRLRETNQITRHDYALDALQVYPNPAKDFLHLRYTLTKATRLHLILQSMDGRRFHLGEERTQAAGTHLITLSLESFNLRDGIYLLGIVSEYGSLIKKIRIE